MKYISCIRGNKYVSYKFAKRMHRLQGQLIAFEYLLQLCLINSKLEVCNI